MNRAHVLLLAPLLAVAPRLAHAEEAAPTVFAKEAPTKMHSPGLMAGGIVLTSLGAIQVGLATAIFIGDSRSKGDFSGIVSIVIGLPLLVNGLGCLGGGIPMIAIGAKSVPDTSPKATLSFVPQMGGGALRLTF